MTDRWSKDEMCFSNRKVVQNRGEKQVLHTDVSDLITDKQTEKAKDSGKRAKTGDFIVNFGPY